MDKWTEIAKQLDKARQTRQTMARITIAHPEIHVEQAYQIQQCGIALRQEQGEKLIGFKLGLTSHAKQAQMHVNQPIYGVLTDKMIIPNKGQLALNTLIEPKIEGEIGFIVKKAIKAPVTAEEVLMHCEGVCAAMDVIDSRYQNFQFSLPDVIADNVSAGRCVFGDLKQLSLDDLSHLEMALYQDDTLISEGSSQAVLGNPANAIILLAEILQHSNAVIPAGSMILSGSSMPAMDIKPGTTVSLRVKGLGEVSVSVIANLRSRCGNPVM